MGFFDMFRSKSPADTMQEEMKRLAPTLFPGGHEEIQSTGRSISGMLDNRIPADAAARLFASTKYLAHTAKDKSKQRVVEYIIRQGMGRISEADAGAIYDRFIANRDASPSASSQSQRSAPSATSDGSTHDRAVVIRATSSVEGIDAEYQWLEAHFGRQGRDWTIEMRMNGTENSKSYETFLIKLASGEKRTVHFDISAFYGRI
jgi:hypothetical protein